MDNNPSDKKSSTSAGVDNHKIINSNTDTMQTGGLFNGKVFPAPAGTYIGTTTSNTNTSQNIKNSASRNAPSIANGTYEKNGVVIERETYNEGEKLQIEEVIKYQKQVIDNNGKSPVHGQNTKQIPTSPISTVKDSGLPGCKASAVPTEHDTIKIDATARSNSECDSETKVNHQKQTFIKTCSIFDSNQKETRQDNQDAIHSLQSGSPTPIPGKKILGNRSPIFCSKHKGKIALVVAGLCIVGAVVAFLLESYIVVSVLAALAAAILVITGIVKACEGPGTEKSNVSVLLNGYTEVNYLSSVCAD